MDKEEKMEIHGESIFSNNKELLTRYVGVHPDDVAALDFAINELIDAGVGMLKEIAVEDSDTYNWVLLLTNDEGQVFYLELSKYGNLVVLRKDGPEGEILQAFQCGLQGLELPEDDKD